MFWVDKIKYEHLAILSDLKSCQFAHRIMIFNLCICCQFEDTGGELGVDASPDEIASSVSSLGLRCGQLAVHGAAKLGAETATAWREVLEKHDITVTTVFAGFTGESYESIPICEQTVGFVPLNTRAEREARAGEVIDFAAAIGVGSFALHVGHLPADTSKDDYVTVCDLVRRVCDRCAGHGLTFALETGQEPAAELLAFIQDVGRDNLKINFDPANLILYGSGEPLGALELVKDHVVSVHCKDGTWPPAKGEWGKETPLGKGDVGMDRYVAKLKEIGYTGPLTIEREILGEEQRADILGAIELLRGLRQGQTGPGAWRYAFKSRRNSVRKVERFFRCWRRSMESDLLNVGARDTIVRHCSAWPGVSPG